MAGDPQVGWSQESRLLQSILKRLERLSSIIGSGVMSVGGILVGEYGSAYVESGPGVKTFTHPVSIYEAWEDTTITACTDVNGSTITTEWETHVIDTSLGKTVIYFYTPIKTMTVSAGGKGQVFYANRD